MKILIADDDATNREIYKAILKKFPEHQTTAVEDGKLAWDLLNDRRHWFDVLILDVQMPEMGGIEVLKLIKDSPFHRSLQVIMCTAANDRTTIVQAIQLGAAHYIVKPIAEPNLMAKLDLAQKALGQAPNQHQRVNLPMA